MLRTLTFLLQAPDLIPVTQSKSKISPGPDLQGVAPIHTPVLFWFLLCVTLCFYPPVFLKSLPPHFSGHTALPQKSTSPYPSLGLFLKTSRVCGEWIPSSLPLGKGKGQLQILRAGKEEHLACIFVVFSMNLQTDKQKNQTILTNEDECPAQNLMDSSLLIVLLWTQIWAYFALRVCLHPDSELQDKASSLNWTELIPQTYPAGRELTFPWPCLSHAVTLSLFSLINPCPCSQSHPSPWG